MRRKYTRPYVGITVDGKREVFRAAKPNRKTHGRYVALVGPFKTRGAAEVMSRQMGKNPHIRCVTDAENAAKKVKAVKV